MAHVGIKPSPKREWKLQYSSGVFLFQEPVRIRVLVWGPQIGMSKWGTGVG